MNEMNPEEVKLTAFIHLHPCNLQIKLGKSSSETEKADAVHCFVLKKMIIYKAVLKL